MPVGFVVAARGPAAMGAPRDIPALDGVRAVAALSVLFYHSYQLFQPTKTAFGMDITLLWNYTQTGVHLFFILSGFLLFTPFARALLEGRPLPSTRRFYQRRALRILPTYWGCLLILSLVLLPQLTNPVGAQNVLAHGLLLHDVFPQFNRSIEGPFWTLALEAQFYLVLPLLAMGMARVVGGTCSVARLTLCVLGLMAGALLLRGVDAIGQHALASLSGPAYVADLLLVRSTLGSQGKFLEVFALGMLCAVGYIVLVEQRALARGRRWWSARRVGLALAPVGALLALWLVPATHAHKLEAPSYETVGQLGNWYAFFGPFLIGIGYAVLLMAILLIGGVVRAFFALPLLRAVGLMSYSLYLWHLPFVHGWMPFMRDVSVAGRVLTAFVVAILSYWLLERPFLLQRRRLTAPAPASPGPPTTSPEMAARAHSGRPLVE